MAKDRSQLPSLTQRLEAIALERPFGHALDIGCGAGELSLRLARARPDSQVTGLDISESLLAVAAERGRDLPNLRFEYGDAAAWDFGGVAAPDLLVSRHGVMFFDDPVAAFTHLRAGADEGARLVFSCFCKRENNVWANELAQCLGMSPPAGPDRSPGPFAFGEEDYVEGILAGAGWSGIGFEKFDYAMIAGDGPDALGDAVSYFLRIGPAARAIADLPGDRRDEAIAGLRTMLAGYEDGGQVALPASSWIVTAG